MLELAGCKFSWEKKMKSKFEKKSALRRIRQTATELDTSPPLALAHSQVYTHTPMHAYPPKHTQEIFYWGKVKLQANCSTASDKEPLKQTEINIIVLKQCVWVQRVVFPRYWGPNASPGASYTSIAAPEHVWSRSREDILE